MNLKGENMKFFKPDFIDLSLTKKICLSGILMALIVIFNKVLAINYIIPFARISFGSIALIIFASIVLGPFYGAIIAGVADILGYFMFDMSSFGWFPQITMTYVLMGFLPFFVYKFVKLFKKDKIFMIVEYSIFALILVLVIIFFATQKEINLGYKVHPLSLFDRIFYPSLSALLFVVIIVFNYIINKKVKTDNLPVNIYQISFIVFFMELVVDLLFGGLMKSWAFGWNLLIPIYLVQGSILFFNIPYNSYLIFIIMKTVKRFSR